jgi:hypothetical protein
MEKVGKLGWNANENCRFVIFICFVISLHTQSDSVFPKMKVSVVTGKVDMNMCLFLNGYRDRTVCISRPNSVRFLFMDLEEE